MDELMKALADLFALPNWANRGDHGDVKGALRAAHAAYIARLAEYPADDGESVSIAETEGNEDNEHDDGSDHDATYGLIVPFLDQDPTFALGSEFGMWYQTCRLNAEHGQYVRTENESQMTLACARLGWAVVECRPWDDGWVYLKVANPNPAEELA